MARHWAWHPGGCPTGRPQNPPWRPAGPVSPFARHRRSGKPLPRRSSPHGRRIPGRAAGRRCPWAACPCGPQPARSGCAGPRKNRRGSRTGRPTRAETTETAEKGQGGTGAPPRRVARNRRSRYSSSRRAVTKKRKMNPSRDSPHRKGSRLPLVAGPLQKANQDRHRTKKTRTAPRRSGPASSAARPPEDGPEHRRAGRRKSSDTGAETVSSSIPSKIAPSRRSGHEGLCYRQRPFSSTQPDRTT